MTQHSSFGLEEEGGRREERGLEEEGGGTEEGRVEVAKRRMEYYGGEGVGSRERGGSSRESKWAILRREE